MQITINGVTIDGADKDVLNLLTKAGVDLSNSTEYYYSKSTGAYVQISKMMDTHLANAFNVVYKEWLDNIVKQPKFLQNLKNGVPTTWYKYNVYMGLLTEIIKRGL